MDLHTRSLQICVLDDQGRAVLEKRVPCCLAKVQETLSPFGDEVTIAIESTYNWYWLVDGLMLAGYDVRLAHAYGLHLITGAKVKTDRRDAYRLARYLRLDELPVAYIYPKEKRPYRDLLRRRMTLVQFRSAAYTSLRIQFRQYNCDEFGFDELKGISSDTIEDLPLPEPTELYANMVLEQIQLFSRQIDLLEREILKTVKAEPEVDLLKTSPGIHDILGMTIYYEVGDIRRFKSDKNFASYCRLVPPDSISDGKRTRGKGGKQGNPFLKWAFCQAATHASRYYEDCRRFREKHARRRSGSLANLIANNILAHKIATGAFFVLRDRVPFDRSKMFN
jgi:transposase